jgi:hypothetical protein
MMTERVSLADKPVFVKRIIMAISIVTKFRGLAVPGWSRIEMSPAIRMAMERKPLSPSTCNLLHHSRLFESC